jgi:hypothetical protein
LTTVKAPAKADYYDNGQAFPKGKEEGHFLRAKRRER